MSSDTTDLIAVDALGPDGEYRIRNREPVTATDGVVVAELTLAPPLYVSRAIKAQRAVRPLPAHEREAALAKAADIFANGVLAGLDFDAYTAAGQPHFRRADIGDPRRGARRRRRSRVRLRRRQRRPGRRVRRWTGATYARAARSGPAAATCSRYSHPAMGRGCMGCGRRPWRWATGSRSARRGVSR